MVSRDQIIGTYMGPAGGSWSPESPYVPQSFDSLLVEITADPNANNKIVINTRGLNFGAYMVDEDEFDIPPFQIVDTIFYGRGFWLEWGILQIELSGRLPPYPKGWAYVFSCEKI